jgi:NAD(P)-dependent dehydrogenase (short-subunit alcohol dehydrogenase family)
MKELAGRVAVVTGAASGMGLAFAQLFADEGMSVVLADIESEPLAMAEASIRAKGAKALAVRTNVLDGGEIERLADAAFATFGNVHVLCNNAGVSGGSPVPVWEAPLRDWDWVMGVNFYGVLRGIQAFLPRMLANGEEGHIVNTASVAGLLTGANPYSVAKQGVVCLTEGLYRDLRAVGAKVSASVLCPGWVNTQIGEAERNRPSEYGAAQAPEKLPEAVRARREMVKQFLANGYAPEDIATQVVDAIREDRFYIIPAQPHMLEAIRNRFDGILELRNPDAALL